MKELILIKLGGSVITDKGKPFTARPLVIKKLVKEIKKQYLNKKIALIIGHGGGSYPHVPAAKYQIQKGLINSKSVWGLSQTADAAIQINRIVVAEFLKQKLPVVSFAPLSFVYGGKVIFEHIKKGLDIGIVPVVYGDVVMNKKQGFEIYSGEKTLDLLAQKLSKFYSKVKIIYYTDTNGVYDKRGKTISLITSRNFSTIQAAVVGSKSTDVTGGMLHKVEESLKLIKKVDAEVYIMNGLSKGNFTKISK